MDNSSHTNRFMASLMDGLKDAPTYNSMTPDQRLYVDKVRVEANEKIETLYDEMNFQAKEIALLRAELEAARVDAERYRWLRDRPLDDTVEHAPYIHAAEQDEDYWALNGPQADAAIDAARGGK